MSLEDDVKAECRLHAIEWIVSMHLAATFAQAGADAQKHLDTFRQLASDVAQQKTFSRLDPAMSDFASAEREAAIDRLLSYAKDALAEMLQARKA